MKLFAYHQTLQVGQAFYQSALRQSQSAGFERFGLFVFNKHNQGFQNLEDAGPNVKAEPRAKSRGERGGVGFFKFFLITNRKRTSREVIFEFLFSRSLYRLGKNIM